MIELYDSWNIQKKYLEAKERVSYVNDREVCFVSLGKNIGYEQDGKHKFFERPVVVLKKFGKDTFVGIPLTNSKKIGKYYYSFLLHRKNSTAILSQVRILDTKRVLRKVGYMEQEDFNELKKSLKKLLCL